MRLNKLTIGANDLSPENQFKNLNNITIDFSENHWFTVLLGRNGTGKSNILEFLSIIFADLISKKKNPRYQYQIKYWMGDKDELRYIVIDADPKRTTKKYNFTSYSVSHVLVNNQQYPHDIDKYLPSIKAETISFAQFTNEDMPYLPKFIFSYYSGFNTRLQSIFEGYTKSYEQEMRAGVTSLDLKRMFYTKPIHSKLVLLSFLFENNPEINNTLKSVLNLDLDLGIDSILFELIEPSWTNKTDNGDARFWQARGIVQNFLSELIKFSLAPIKVKKVIAQTLYNKTNKEHLYLYIKDSRTFRDFIKDTTPHILFRNLESAIASDLLKDVHINVKIKDNTGFITHRELSEGELQFLTVLGLIYFTRGKESLILLDEPDTHLNPQWSISFLDYLKIFFDEAVQDKSHVILTTHSPLSISALEKEQVQILSRKAGKISIESPDYDPRGMGVAGILTSDMFGLNSTLDKKTNNKLLRMHQLSTKDHLTDDEKNELNQLNNDLNSLDFNFASRDRLEQEFMRARFDLLTGNFFDGEDPTLTQENKLKALNNLVKVLVNKDF